MCKQAVILVRYRLTLCNKSCKFTSPSYVGKPSIMAAINRTEINQSTFNKKCVESCTQIFVCKPAFEQVLENNLSQRFPHYSIHYMFNKLRFPINICLNLKFVTCKVSALDKRQFAQLPVLALKPQTFYARTSMGQKVNEH